MPNGGISRRARFARVSGRNVYHELGAAPLGSKFCIPHTNGVSSWTNASALRNCRKRRLLFSREFSVYLGNEPLPSAFRGQKPSEPSRFRKRQKKSGNPVEKSLPAQGRILQSPAISDSPGFYYEIHDYSQACSLPPAYSYWSRPLRRGRQPKWSLPLASQ